MMTTLCPRCRTEVTALPEHPPYYLPHGHGYPAVDGHFDPRAGYVVPCSGSGVGPVRVVNR